MPYGFEYNVLQSPYSLILSIFLSLGIINFGKIVIIKINSRQEILRPNLYILHSDEIVS